MLQNRRGAPMQQVTGKAKEDALTCESSLICSEDMHKHVVFSLLIIFLGLLGVNAGDWVARPESSNVLLAGITPFASCSGRATLEQRVARPESSKGVLAGSTPFASCSERATL